MADLPAFYRIGAVAVLVGVELLYEDTLYGIEAGHHTC